MSRTNIPIQEIPLHGATLDDIAWTAGDAANNHDFVSSGKELLLVKNDDAAPHPVTVVSVADAHGRTGDTTITTGASDVSIAGPFRPANWDGELGKAYVDLADATSMFFAVLRILG